MNLGADAVRKRLPFSFASEGRVPPARQVRLPTITNPSLAQRAHRNNRDGIFTDITANAGVGQPATGEASPIPHWPVGV